MSNQLKEMNKFHIIDKKSNMEVQQVQFAIAT